MDYAFISYSSPDSEIASRIRDALDQIVDLGVWFDVSSLRGGQNLSAELERAIQFARFYVLVVSNDSMKRSGVYHAEIRAASDVGQTKPEGHVYAIVCQLDDCNVPRAFDKTVRLDFRDPEQGIRQLRRAIIGEQNRQYAKGSVEGVSLTCHAARLSVSCTRPLYFATVHNRSRKKIELSHLLYEDAFKRIEFYAKGRKLPVSIEREWHLFKRSDGKFAWHLVADNGSDIIATDGGQGYDNPVDAAEIMKKIRSGHYKDCPMEPS